MTVRQAVLPVSAVLVLGFGVYLFFAVRADPAPPQGKQAPRAPRPTVLARPEATAMASPPAPQPAKAAADPVTVVADPGTPQMIAATENRVVEQGPKSDGVMDAANKAYDRGEFEDAKVIAGRVLERDPTNVRMLRIMVSTSCMDGDTAAAQIHFANLPPGDQEQMKTRCARYGITFPPAP